MALRGPIRPVDTIRKGLVLVVFLYNFPVPTIRIRGVKAHDLETIMHRCH